MYLKSWLKMTDYSTRSKKYFQLTKITPGKSKAFQKLRAFSFLSSVSSELEDFAGLFLTEFSHTGNKGSRKIRRFTYKKNGTLW